VTVCDPFRPRCKAGPEVRCLTHDAVRRRAKRTRWHRAASAAACTLDGPGPARVGYAPFAFPVANTSRVVCRVCIGAPGAQQPETAVFVPGSLCASGAARTPRACFCKIRGMQLVLTQHGVITDASACLLLKKTNTSKDEFLHVTDIIQ
jgi:hypothetical protein